MLQALQWTDGFHTRKHGELTCTGSLHCESEGALLCSGRKKAALTYVATYMFGCLTKHWNHFQILLIGRVFCGVATSLLYSAFESWLVAEHFKVSAFFLFAAFAHQWLVKGVAMHCACGCVVTPML